MQRSPTPQTLLRSLRTLHATSGLLTELLIQLGTLRQYSFGAPQPAYRHADQPKRPSQLGQLCKEFQECARRNSARQAEQLHARYLAQGGEPKLWMVNTLIGVYARRREVDKAFALYESLLQQGSQLEPNEYTYGSLLNALAKSEHPPYNLAPEVVGKAEALFHKMVERGLQPNKVSFHTLMDVQAKAAQPDAAFATYRSMLAAGLAPDVTSFSILMTACGRAGDHRRAAEVMEKLMPQAGVAPTTAIWNSMLGAYAKSGSVDGAYATWVRMLESGATPDSYTERALVDALSSHPALAADVVAEAREIRQRIAQQAQQEEKAGRASQGFPPRPAGAAGKGDWERRQREGTAASAAATTSRSGGSWGDGHLGPEGGAGTEGGCAGGEAAQRGSTAVRQGELLVDDFCSSTTTPMAGTAYGRQLYRTPGYAAGAAAPTAGTPGGKAGAPGEAPARLNLRSLLWLDLHGMSQAVARASLLRRLEMLVNLAQELVIQVQDEREAPAPAQRMQQVQQAQRGGRGGASMWQQQQQHSPPLAPPQQQAPQGPGTGAGKAGAAHSRRTAGQQHALIIITGVGRRSKEAGAGVLKEAVTQLLGQHGIPWEEDAANAGRVVVPWPGLRDFVQMQREAMQTDHFFSVARMRYTYIGAGVAGLMAAAYILPRLAPWMPA